MRRSIKFFLCLVLAWVVLYLSQASARDLALSHIVIKGLKGINRETVLSYLPLKSAEPFSDQQSSDIIDALYATGFFSDIKLKKDHNTLIIYVVERPTISEVTLSGINKNQFLPKDKLDEILKKIGLVQGRWFDQAALNQFITQLRLQYDMLGKYSARVNTTVLRQSNNRVAIRINVSEGLSVRLGGVTILGNQAFSESALLSALPLSATGFWHRITHYFTDADQYIPAKLGDSLEALRAYYLDRGYLKFKIDSTQVTLTPDKKTAYVIIHVTEGPRYNFSGYALKGRVLLDKSTSQRILQRIKNGTAFSRQKVMQVKQEIEQALGEFGYYFAKVNILPLDVNEKNKTVFMTFYVEPGRQVYVRHINISGNLKTQDLVFRRMLRQQEASLLSSSDIKESVRQLNLSGFVEMQQQPEINIIPVSGSADQVDLDINLKEAHAAQALFSFGYGTNGSVLGATLNQNNVFGTGNTLNLNFQNTRVLTSYNISYNNPYYTLDGVQRGFDVFFERSTPSNLNTTSYSTNSYGADLKYTIPIDIKGDSLTFIAGLQKLELNLPVFSEQSAEVQDFFIQHAAKFNQFNVSMSWQRNGHDRFYFPQEGVSQSAYAGLFLPLGGKPLSYYKLQYGGDAFYPLGHGFILRGSWNFGYGNGLGSTKALPFFANYYAGGVGVTAAVRGYEVSSLGPRDTLGYPLGGNIMTAGSVALIVPMPVSVAEQVRTSVFVDAGNVYSSLGITQPNKPRGGTASGPLRYSTGIDIDWRVPVFNVVLGFSVAKAVNPRPGDQTQVFQFNIGSN